MGLQLHEIGKSFAGIWVAASLMACGNSSIDKPPVKLFETERWALEKAKALEQQQQQHADDRRKQTEEEQ